MVPFCFIKAVSQCGCRRFVDNAQNVQTGNFTGVFGGLTLRIVKIGRNRDNRLVNFLAEIAFGVFFDLLQNNCRNLRRRIFLSLNFNPGVAVVAGNDFERNQLFVFFNFRRIVTASD